MICFGEATFLPLKFVPGFEFAPISYVEVERVAIAFVLFGEVDEIVVPRSHSFTINLSCVRRRLND